MARSEREPASDSFLAHQAAQFLRNHNQALLYDRVISQGHGLLAH
jgi:hypothetical protein